MVSKKHLNLIEENFRKISRQKQRSFLDHLYKISKENTDIFEVWLNNGEEKVTERLIKEIEKETLNRIGRFRKLRVAKLNQLMKNAEKYPLSNVVLIELYKNLWEDTAQFIIKTGYCPNRYRISCINYLSGYFEKIQSIRETQERLDKENETKEKILEFIKEAKYFPHLEDFYGEKFGNEKLL